MGRVLLIFVGISVMVGGIIYLFRLMFSGRMLLEKAKQRFNEALSKLDELKNDYFIQQKTEYYEQAEVRLLKHSMGSDPVEWYDRHADEIEELLENPSEHLERRVYDPVDNSLLREDAVEVVCDHPTTGKIYVTVNRWNLDQIDKIFSRKKGYHSSSRYYRIRTERKLPSSGATIIQQDNGMTLTDALLLNYLLTDHHVHVHHYDEPVQIRHTHSDDDGAVGFDGRRDDGYEQPINHAHHQRPDDDNDVIVTTGTSGDTAFFGRTSESEPVRDAPVENKFGGGEFGGGGASGNLDDDPVIVDPFEASSHAEPASFHETSEVHEAPSFEPDTSSHDSGSGTAY